MFVVEKNNLNLLKFLEGEAKVLNGAHRNTGGPAVAVTRYFSPYISFGAIYGNAGEIDNITDVADGDFRILYNCCSNDILYKKIYIYFLNLI